MLEFIKMFGLGILYTILFPVIVVFFALVLVFVLVNYLVMECINCVGFFFGNTFTVETDLDKELKKIKAEKKQAEEVKDAVLEATYEDFSVDPFGIEEGSDLQ